MNSKRAIKILTKHKSELENLSSKLDIGMWAATLVSYLEDFFGKESAYYISMVNFIKSYNKQMTGRSKEFFMRVNRIFLNDFIDSQIKTIRDIGIKRKPNVLRYDNSLIWTVFIFCLGLSFSVGLWVKSLNNKQEIDKLNEEIKQKNIIINLKDSVISSVPSHNHAQSKNQSDSTGNTQD